MSSRLEHVMINISDPTISFPFYRRFFAYLGYASLLDDEDHIAFRKNGTPDFWIMAADKEYSKNGFHRKNVGLNHFAFHVDSKEEVDRFMQEFLVPQQILPLYDTPKTFPEYTPEYYAVFFEDPDRMKLEVCFIGNERIAALEANEA